ncbi:carboxymuconolactone decarboxylase family protein [Glycomyces sp. NPDC049804]|uniref:carboxymuconolactone decarboxylase family protein n=1 Tax=Glycomyces sp. NPDC049804 TaxID=3154363 RepID=UPI0034335DAA
MEARMTSPAILLPDAYKAIGALNKAISATSVPESTLELVHLRASQINGCAGCVVFGIDQAKQRGETDDRLHSVAVWRESPLFTDAERAALALTEAATRIADRPDAVTDEIWLEAVKHFGEEELAAILLMIGMTNLFNRLNVPTRQPAVKSW